MRGEPLFFFSAALNKTVFLRSMDLPFSVAVGKDVDPDSYFNDYLGNFKTSLPRIKYSRRYTIDAGHLLPPPKAIQPM